MNRKVLLIGLVVVTPLLVFLALSFRSDPRIIDSPLIGKPAPGFTLSDLEGRVWALDELRGRPVVINFWASWCQPCIYEHPFLQEAAERYRGRVQFLGVIYQDERVNIERFIRQRGAWGPTLVDDDVGVALAYGVYGAPETFFIGRDGLIADKVTGPVDPRRLRRLLDGLLAS